MASYGNPPSQTRKITLSQMIVSKRTDGAAGDVTLSQIRSTLFSPLAIKNVEPSVAKGRFARWFERTRRDG